MSEELAHREEEIIQSKKLASLGILTAGVAHEITNPLNNISMIAQTYAELYQKLGEEDRIEFMNKVDAETERIRKIVKNLLDFSKPKDANPKEADINAVIQKTLTLVQNMIDVSNIETSVHLADGLPHVFVDEHQIQQVLVNLVTNAVQAMTAGGRLVHFVEAGEKRRFRRDRRCGYRQGHRTRVPSPYLRSLFQHQGRRRDRASGFRSATASSRIIKERSGWRARSASARPLPIELPQLQQRGEKQ